MSNTLTQVVNVQFTLSNPQVSVTNFGTPLLMTCLAGSGYAGFVGLVNSYSSVAGLTAAGFNAGHPAVIAATEIFAQNPAPTNIMVGKRTALPTQIIDLVPVNTSQGFVYSFSIVSAATANPSALTTTPISYTVPGAATVTSIATAIEGLIVAAAPPGVTPSNPAGSVVLTSSIPGAFFNLTGLPLPQNLSIFDNTAETAPTTATDVGSVFAVDGGVSWYSVHHDHISAAQICGGSGLDAWVEANSKISLQNLSDTAALTLSASGDTGSTPSVTCSAAHILQAATAARTGILHSANQLLPYSAAAWCGEMLATTPGAANWAFKSIVGAIPDAIRQADYAVNAKAKNLNSYQTLGGRNVTLWGTTAAGWWDIEVGIDWLLATIQSACWSVTVANQKIPYTDTGMLSYKAAVNGVLATAVQNGLVAPGYTISVASVASVTSATRASRSSPPITFSCIFQGAVNAVNVIGTGSF